MLAALKLKKVYNNKVKSYNEDLMKVYKGGITRIKKLTI